MSIIARENLTKSLLMELEYGAFIASNSYIQRRLPVFAEEVRSLQEREDQWQRIKKCKANNKLCTVYISKKHFQEHEDAMFGGRNR